jgi:hypothetical protein
MSLPIQFLQNLCEDLGSEGGQACLWDVPLADW